ncbi:MAG: HD domain-containing protein [Desulfocapsaceae bacterium]|nr:HD domain-containing protein [Desulfocapsaceae bacterium]
MHYTEDTNRLPPLKSFFPKPLFEALDQLRLQRGLEMYASGGTIRDWLLGRQPVDLDITVAKGAEKCCRELLRILQAGAFVPLGTETEEAARVVWQGVHIDFSSFRKGAVTIEEELQHRDFTINAMALAMRDVEKSSSDIFIDPLKGLDDLQQGSLQSCPEAFIDDPLRMLRGYRFQAELDFVLTGRSVAEINDHCQLISQCAAERILYELDRIMRSAKAPHVFREMAASGLLWVLFPELQAGVGMEQPGYHHEDVFQHSLLALQWVQKVIDDPQAYFSDDWRAVADYLSSADNRRILRWAAVLHDLGKPATISSGTIKKDRITFYNHDRVGRLIFEEIADRLRMKKADVTSIGRLIEMHMHPFHLSNVRRQKPLSRKALLKIYKKAGDYLSGLFVVAMADSLAGQGDLKPDNMETELAELFDEIQQARKMYIEPALLGERLLTGHDLIDVFNLEPGPHFKYIFSALEVARVEGRVNNREEALAWLQNYLDEGESQEFL